MRSLKQVDTDINRCKAQIAATYDNHTWHNTEDITIAREGFQIQLKKLEDERKKVQALRNIEVINPRVGIAYESEDIDLQFNQ